uniref:Peroxisomal membrane protein PEX14-like KPWE domain-containing protein n=1 Tax=Poecilia latipinna TaxID=48699 RepID=A0A3B3VAL9_9TELE
PTSIPPKLQRHRYSAPAGAAADSNGETKQLSFAEVMQLVQEGREVPGVTNRHATEKPSLTEVMFKLRLLRDKTKSTQENISTMSVAPSYEERGKCVISVPPLMHLEHTELLVKHVK